MLVEMIKLHEGLSLRPYKCTAGKLTIGVGRNIEDNGISEEESDFLLQNDIKRCEKELESLSFWGSLDEVRKCVLIDMCFNLGITRLKGFKKTLGYISVGSYENAANEMLDSNWADQVGQRAQRLSLMMKTGEWYD